MFDKRNSDGHGQRDPDSRLHKANMGETEPQNIRRTALNDEWKRWEINDERRQRKSVRQDAGPARLHSSILLEDSEDDLCVSKRPKIARSNCPAKIKGVASPSRSRKRLISTDDSSDDDEIESDSQRTTSSEDERETCHNRRRSNEDGDHDEEEESVHHESSSDESEPDPGGFHDNICFHCHTQDSLVPCQGGCYRSWHKRCLPRGFRQAKGNFSCKECDEGKWQCWYCQQSLLLHPSGKCNVQGCGRHYHLRCIISLPMTEVLSTTKETFKCPRHSCGMCKGNLGWTKNCMRCIECPISYHRKCMPLGAPVLADTRFRCARHYDDSDILEDHNFMHCGKCAEKKSIFNDSRWVNCFNCPKTYHSKCVPSSRLALQECFLDNRWYCENCVSGNVPRSGDHVWVKTAGYPFWPAKVVSSDRASRKLLNEDHDETHIAVRWYGKVPYEYSWMKNPCIGRYEDMDKSRIKERPRVFLDAIRQIENAVKTKSKKRIQPCEAEEITKKCSAENSVKLRPEDEAIVSQEKKGVKYGSKKGSFANSKKLWLDDSETD